MPGSAQVQEQHLPLPDRCMDRILLIHALEASEGAHAAAARMLARAAR